MASRTSFSQFTIMVDFMERNGDLSKPSGGPRGRQWCIAKWRELTTKLNSEGTGESRSEERWRKVNEPRAEPPASPMETQSTVVDNDTPYSWPVLDEDTWNTPHCSSGPTRMPPSQPLQPPTSPPRRVTSPIRPDSTTPVRVISPPPSTSPTPNAPSSAPPAARRKKRKITSTAMEDQFLNLEMNAREADRERDRMYADLERERIRQRDIELQLQAQWLEFMKEAMNVLMNFLNGKK